MVPMHGAVVTLGNISPDISKSGSRNYANDTAPTKDPLSDGDATSIITPCATEEVPEGDVSTDVKTRNESMPKIARACGNRWPGSAEEVLDRTMAILAAM